MQPQEVPHVPRHPFPVASELRLLPQPQRVSPRWPSWEPQTDWRHLCRTDPARNCAPPALEVGSPSPNRLLPHETGLRRKASDPVQRCYGNGSTWTLSHKALTGREKPWSLPFSPMGKGENSQGPVKIKIYITFVTLYNLCNLYNLHHRHLLVILLLVWLGLCGWSGWPWVSCVWTAASLGVCWAELLWRQVHQAVLSVDISAEAIEGRTTVAGVRILHYRPAWPSDFPRSVPSLHPFGVTC